MNAMSLVQHFEKPDIFLTITCNPSKKIYCQQIKLQNRPDLICRVFREKLEELKKDILKMHMFGKVAAFMYTI